MDTLETMDAAEEYLRSHLLVVGLAYLGLLWARRAYKRGVKLAYRNGLSDGFTEARVAELPDDQADDQGKE